MARAFFGESVPASREAPPSSTRMYAAAVPSRFNQGFPSFNTSEDLELTSSLRNLRARSRTLIRDAGYAKSARREVVNNVIGTGVRMQPAVKNSRGGLNARINENIGDAWSHWMHGDNCHTGGSLHFHDLERMCMGQVFDAGEIFLRIHRKKFGRSRVPLALEIVEPERIVDGYAYPGEVSTKSGGVRLGIETDMFKRPLAYWIRDLHPGDIRLNLEQSDAVTRVDAADVIHIYVIDRWPQTRGIPWIHAAAGKIQDVNGYSEAEVIAARIAASYAGAIESPEGPEAFADKSPDNTFQISSEPGVLLKLNQGEKINFGTNAGRPNAQLDPFMRYMLREIAAAVGVSYESLSKDYSAGSYSSMRQSLLSERDCWRVLQQWWIRSFRHRLHREWMNAAVLAGAVEGLDPYQFAGDAERYLDVRFRPRGWSWIDPTKEVTAYVQSVKSGFKTLSDVIDETGSGNDFEDVMKTRQTEIADLDEMNLAFDTSPTVYVPAETRGQMLVGEDGKVVPAASVIPQQTDDSAGAGGAAPAPQAASEDEPSDDEQTEPEEDEERAARRLRLVRGA